VKRVRVVTGTREHAIPREQLAADLGDFDLLIVGDARGADLSAFAYARDVLGLSIDAGSIRVHYADDYGEGNGRFLRRNVAIAEDAARELAAGSEVNAYGYPCKKSRGTWHCIKQLTARGINPTVVRV
jgi:hypothetical protein